MNESTDIMKKTEGDTICSKLKKLAFLSAEADYDVTLHLSDTSGDNTSECSHHLKGRSRHSLLNLLAIGGLVAAVIGALVCFVHVFCSLVCGSR